MVKSMKHWKLQDLLDLMQACRKPISKFGYQLAITDDFILKAGAKASILLIPTSTTPDLIDCVMWLSQRFGAGKQVIDNQLYDPYTGRTYMPPMAAHVEFSIGKLTLNVAIMRTITEYAK